MKKFKIVLFNNVLGNMLQKTHTEISGDKSISIRPVELLKVVKMFSAKKKGIKFNDQHITEI